MKNHMEVYYLITQFLKLEGQKNICEIKEEELLVVKGLSKHGG